MTAGGSRGFDARVAHPARVYDYWPGGKDHYAADRAEADRLLAIYPPLRDLVRESRGGHPEPAEAMTAQGLS